MTELSKAPAFVAALELLASCERRTASWREDALAADLRAYCVILLAQSVFVALLGDVPARRAAIDEMRRAARRLSILIDVAQARQQLDAAAAGRLRVRLGAAMHATRPRKPQATVRPPPPAVIDDAVTLPEVPRGKTRIL